MTYSSEGSTEYLIRQSFQYPNHALTQIFYIHQILEYHLLFHCLLCIFVSQNISTRINISLFALHLCFTKYLNQNKIFLCLLCIFASQNISTRIKYFFVCFINWINLNLCWHIYGLNASENVLQLTPMVLSLLIKRNPCKQLCKYKALFTLVLSQYKLILIFFDL